MAKPHTIPLRKGHTDMAKKPAAQAISEAATAINTLSMDAGVGGKLTKTYASVPCRKVYRFPAVPDGVQVKKSHMQIRFGGLYASQDVTSLTEVEKATFALAYATRYANGQTSPSYSGSGEAYVPMTVTPTVSVVGGPVTGGLVQLDGVTVLTFEVDPSVDLMPKPKHQGVYHETPDGDDPDEDPEPDDDGDGDGDDD